MYYLAASCIALLLGPLFYRYFSSGSGLQKGLDGFIFVSLGGLVLIHILPELIEHGGLASILFVIIGLWGPTASEKLFHKYSEITHNLTLILGIGGLLLHTLTDGSVMVLAQQQGNSALLALGIILHRLPVGLAIWWLLKPQVGTKWAWIVLITMMALTGIGYFAGTQMLTHLSIDNTVYLQAFVTGSILHVVLHQPHGENHSHDSSKYEYQAGIGSILGVVLLVILLSLEHGHNEHVHASVDLTQWIVLLSPALLIAYLVASIRFRLGLKPDSHHLGLCWLQRLAGPEALIISLLLLGPSMMLIQIGSLLLVGAYLTYYQIPLTQDNNTPPHSSLAFGFGYQVQKSAPWILLSLILVNLIGHPSSLLANPITQILLLSMLFLPMRFCNLGAAVLALALAFNGWSDIVVLLALIAAPILNLAQLKLMNLKQRVGLFILILLLLAVSLMTPLVWQQFLIIPHGVDLLSVAVIACLFTASLLKMGPRKFLSQLMLKPANKM